MIRTRVELPPEPDRGSALGVRGHGGTPEPGERFSYDDVLLWYPSRCLVDGVCREGLGCSGEWAVGRGYAGYTWPALVYAAMRSGYPIEILGEVETLWWRAEKRAG